MTEANYTLNTFYKNWQLNQALLRDAVAPLTAAQLTLRAAPHLRSIGELVEHIIKARVAWFVKTLGEGSKKIESISHEGADELPTRTAAELVHDLDLTLQLMMSALARWTPAEMEQTFQRKRSHGDEELSRSWIVWHVLEHDLHHGGEVSLTLGMHGLQAPDI